MPADNIGLAVPITGGLVSYSTDLTSKHCELATIYRVIG